MKLIETHAHIYSKEYKDDLGFIIERSIENSVDKIYMPNIDHASIDDMLELESKYPEYCIPMMGLHPCSVKKNFEKELYLVEDWLKKRKFAAIGETGTDLYWDKTLFPYQQEAFKIQLALAKEYKVPIVIHCRDSFKETIELVESEASDDLTGVFHCFTGSIEEAQRVINAGFFLGIGGVATFKNGGLDKVLPELGLESLILETDSPYLAPVPYRGKRNEPSYITIVAERVAQLCKKDVEEVAFITTENSIKIFSGADEL
ncbi:MAG: TatD family hydrolase [Bacteroidota bacterium]|nr:TatD family hydrolase [Bacteroidota bacterium]